MGDEGRLTSKILSKLPYLRACQVNLDFKKIFFFLQMFLISFFSQIFPISLSNLSHFPNISNLFFFLLKSSPNLFQLCTDGEPEAASSHLWHWATN